MVQLIVVVAYSNKLHILVLLNIEALGLKLRDSIVYMPRGIYSHIEVYRRVMHKVGAYAVALEGGKYLGELLLEDKR